METSAATPKTDFSTSLLRWQRRYGRHDLPWQRQDAYRVWLSEIMLQQTQVNTVIPYYHNFLQQFPDIEALANANIDQVLQHWQGLGYYARARNLYQAARVIRDQYQGKFPETMEKVETLPGIGRSTAGAILSFAFGQNWPILDGNVKRVLARCFQVPGWYGQGETMKQLWRLSTELTPAGNSASFNQGMMDVGSILCLKSRPKCAACPLTEFCASYRDHTQALYPEKKPKKVRPLRQTLMLLHRFRDQVLLYRRPPSGIWGGLWSLPEVDDESQIETWQQGFLSKAQPAKAIQRNLLRHQFSHYNLDISLAIIDLEQLPSRIADRDNHAWVNMARLKDYGLPTPVRKLLTSPQPTKLTVIPAKAGIS